MKNDANPINEIFYSQFNINNDQNIMSETTHCNINLVKDNIDNDLQNIKSIGQKIIPKSSMLIEKD